MAHTRKANYSQRYRKPPLLNGLLVRFSQINPLTQLEFPMPTSRRNIIIRTIATITGDIAAGLAMASIASWVIQYASLGLFLGFLMWLLAAIASLAVSQYLVHPTLKVFLTDKKLDIAADTVSGLVKRLSLMTRTTQQSA